jgi:2-keto-4-pentenoate hydratase
VILPGSMTAVVHLDAGSTVAADFGGLGRMELSAR